MPFNINSFKEHISGSGYLKNNNFEVFVTTPAALQNTNLNSLGTTTPTDSIAANLRYRIEQVRIPGAALLSAEVQKYGIGPTQKMPFTAQLAETGFSVLVDQTAENWQFWYHWIRTVFEFNGTEPGSSIGSNKLPRYVAEYKENYSTTIQIVVYDEFGNAVQRVNLYEAFPTSIRELPLSWGDNQNLMRLAVSIAYTEYTMLGSSFEPPDASAGKVTSTSDTRIFTP